LRRLGVYIVQAMTLLLLETTVDVSLGWSVPFALLLLSIAVMPFAAKHWWETHYPKVAIGLALIPAFYYFAILRAPGPWILAMEEYVSFILLLAALFIISGGIIIRVNRKATPLANCTMLAMGAVLANIFGTTGASMLLIRPFLHMNRGHLKPYHVIFFIFTVSNCGGMLTPIGDPPLFLGYLNGIPFFWTLTHLWPIWLTTNVLLLIVFLIVDTIDHRGTLRTHSHDAGPQIHILGVHNLLFIGVVLFAVFRPSVFEAVVFLRDGGFSAGRTADVVFSRELLMVAATVLSLRLTARSVYEHNEFSYAPIREVAILFVGIFSTMAPALGYLENNADQLRIRTPGEFYYTTGVLSSLLDNAPTYLTFMKVRLSELDPEEVRQAQDTISTMAHARSLRIPESLPDGRVRNAVEEAVRDHGDLILGNRMTVDRVRVSFLVGDPGLNAFIIAVSAGAVLFGACTYIGNGPNFMVKSIAESHGCRTPSFVGYVIRYTLPILLPVYVLIWYLFL
jgi:Na+/H+ antiporter NhaD/arsenite permease-like protein